MQVVCSQPILYVSIKIDPTWIQTGNVPQRGFGQNHFQSVQSHLLHEWNQKVVLNWKARCWTRPSANIRTRITAELLTNTKLSWTNSNWQRAPNWKTAQHQNADSKITVSIFAGIPQKNDENRESAQLLQTPSFIRNRRSLTVGQLFQTMTERFTSTFVQQLWLFGAVHGTSIFSWELQMELARIPSGNQEHAKLQRIHQEIYVLRPGIWAQLHGSLLFFVLPNHGGFAVVHTLKCFKTLFCFTS